MNNIVNTLYKIRKTLSVKSKIFDWIDDNILYYGIDVPISKYKTIKSWFIYNFNKQHFNVVKSAFLGYAWDNQYLDYLIEAKLNEQYSYFSNTPYCGEQKTKTVRKYLKLACDLAYIINHSDEYWDYPFGGSMDADTYICKVYVNTKNKNRFAYPVEDINNPPKIIHATDMYDSCPHELYIAKARRLLYRIIDERGPEWWD